MKAIVFLWLFIWGGLYSDITKINSGYFFSNGLTFFQGARALLPLLAMGLCILYLVAARFHRVPGFKSSLDLLFYYCIVGFVAGAISLRPLTSMYWASLYLCPILVVWYAMLKRDPLGNIRRIINVNYFVFVLLLVAFLPIVFGRGIRGWNDLPFGLGEVNRNGIARYAVVVAVFSFVRILVYRKIKRYLYLVFMIPALYIIAQSQSRSALLGLAVVTVIIFYLKGLNWRFIIAGPAFAYLIWLAGFQWRAEGEIDKLVSLTGREYTWEKAVSYISNSPFYGWGFQADRIMLDFEHIHNSYIHAMIQSGLLGALFFILAFLFFWRLVFKNIKKIKYFEEKERVLIIEAIAIMGFLTIRSFFESTAAFYGVDLLIFIPYAAYIQIISKIDPLNKESG